MTLPIPSLTLSAGGGGPSGASANNGVNQGSTNPFNFDNSGWVINLHSNGNENRAAGNTGANTTAASGGNGLQLPPTNMILMAVAVLLVLKKWKS